MLASAPLSEMWFYWFHRLMHKYDWLYDNIHYELSEQNENGSLNDNVNVV